jgi:hypothetical protein
MERSSRGAAPPAQYAAYFLKEGGGTGGGKKSVSSGKKGGQKGKQDHAVEEDDEEQVGIAAATPEEQEGKEKEEQEEDDSDEDRVEKANGMEEGEEDEEVRKEDAEKEVDKEDCLRQNAEKEVDKDGGEQEEEEEEEGGARNPVDVDGEQPSPRKTFDGKTYMYVPSPAPSPQRRFVLALFPDALPYNRQLPDQRTKIPAKHLRLGTGANESTGRTETSLVWAGSIKRLSPDAPFGAFTHVCVHPWEVDGVVSYCNTLIKSYRPSLKKATGTSKAVPDVSKSFSTTQAAKHLTKHETHPAAVLAAARADERQEDLINMVGGVTKMDWDMRCKTSTMQ